MHPKAAGIGAAVLAAVILIGSLSDSGDRQHNAAAAGSPPTTASTSSSAAASPAPTAPPTPAAPPASSSPARVSAAPVDRTQRSTTTAAALLATIIIKGRAAKTGYSRAQYGSAWTDDNNDPLGRNGCDTRNDILRRDLTAISLKTGSNGCTVLTGTLHDPYTNRTLPFTRGQSTSTAVQIDHVVALSDAWQTGAARWSTQSRTDLANDPLELLAVDGPTNEAKGDGDAASWLPPNTAYRCAYVARQVAVKARYELWMTSAEHDAIARILTGCRNQPAPTETGSANVQRAPHTTTAPTPKRTTTKPAPQTTAGDVYYQNCDAVRAAGAAPLLVGQPGYSRKLDRDGDGVACEP